jgi:hypothetical protein
VIIVPKNSIYKTPEFIFRNVDKAIVEKFLIPIEQSRDYRDYRDYGDRCVIPEIISPLAITGNYQLQ